MSLAALSASLVSAASGIRLLFAKPGSGADGLSEEQAKSRQPAIVFGLTFVLSLVAAYVFAMFLGRNSGSVRRSARVLGRACAGSRRCLGISYLFERRPLDLWLINGGYHTLQFTLFGVILGWLH